MAKKVIGFNSEDDFDRMSRSVRKSENTPQVGQRQRAKYPQGGGGIKVRRAVISEKGDYNTHKVLFTSGTFTEDTTTDDVDATVSEDIAYVGEEFDFRIEVGDPVRVAKFDSRWWIIDAQQACRGYCIDDPQDTAYVYGWYFIAPVLTCCPEATGPMLLTTSDSGATYESPTFQCNSDGTDRTWIFDGTKLYLSPMLDEGNVQFQTDQTPANCTIELKKYEGFIFPYSDCGIKQESVCLHPVCGIDACASCDNGTPLYYEGAFTGQLTSNPFYGQSCSIQSPFLFRYKQNSSSGCEWYTRFRDVNEREFRLQPENTPPSVASTALPTTLWEMPSGSTFDYYGVNVFTLSSESNRCFGWPDTITVYPKINELAETNCNPAVWKVITDDGFSASANSDVVCWEVPRFWFVEVSGVTNDVCSDCDVFNGSFVLDYFTGQLGQSANITSTCASGTPVTYRLSWGLDSGTWYMYLWCRTSTPNYYATYTKNLGSDAFGINCIGPNVLTLDSNSTDCQTWPATLTVYPLT